MDVFASVVIPVSLNLRESQFNKVQIPCTLLKTNTIKS